MSRTTSTSANQSARGEANAPAITQAQPRDSRRDDELITLDDVARISKLGRTKIYDLIKQGVLKKQKYGRSTRFWLLDVVEALDVAGSLQVGRGE